MAEQRRGTAADLVVETTVRPGLPAVPGVAFLSAETETLVQLTTGHGEEAETDVARALVVDPAGYAKAHPGSGPLDALRGAARRLKSGAWMRPEAVTRAIAGATEGEYCPSFKLLWPMARPA